MKAIATCLILSMIVGLVGATVFSGAAFAFDVRKAIDQLPDFDPNYFKGPSRQYKGITLVGVPNNAAANDRFMEAVFHAMRFVEKMPAQSKTAISKIGRIIYDPQGRFSKHVEDDSLYGVDAYGFDPSAEGPGVVIFRRNLSLVKPIDLAVGTFLKLGMRAQWEDEMRDLHRRTQGKPVVQIRESLKRMKRLYALTLASPKKSQTWASRRSCMIMIQQVFALDALDGLTPELASHFQSRYRAHNCKS